MMGVKHNSLIELGAKVQIALPCHHNSLTVICDVIIYIVDSILLELMAKYQMLTTQFWTMKDS
jgi:hypothetical protein